MPQVSRQLLRAGVARVNITPPVGIRMLGYTVQEECSRSVEQELTGTALVLAAGETRMAIVACDILHIQNPHSDRIRESIARRSGIPASHILINGSHTHLGPMLPGWQSEPPEQAAIQQAYLAFLEQSLAGVVAMACSALAPARMASGVGSAILGVNRREKLPDGRVIIGENPTGPIDRGVDLVRVDDLSGRPIAAVVSAAAHTITLGPKTTSLSPDFIGPARTIFEQAIGAPMLFLQGAAGNINPVTGIGAGGPEQFDDQFRLGATLAGEALKVWAALRTHHRRGPRQIVKSVATLSTWGYEPEAVESVEWFGVARRRLVLDLVGLPDPAAIARQLNHYRSERDRVAADPHATAGARHVAERMFQWAALVDETHRRGENPPQREIELWAARINGTAIAAVSAEPLAELGLAVKAQSPVAHTIFLGYSNGCIGYIPPPEAFAEGGMEVVESTWNYHLPSQLTPRWAPTVVETALALLDEV